MPNFCYNCGEKLNPNAKFCPNCGEKLSAPADAPMPAPAAAQPAAVSSTTADLESLQTELYSLYKILEPVNELDSARRKVSAKIAELSAPKSEIDARLRMNYVYAVPLIKTGFYGSETDIVDPADRKDKKSWAAFVKRINNSYKYDKTDEGKFELRDIYRLLKQNQSKILKKKEISFLYYKICYIFEEPESPAKYLKTTITDVLAKRTINNNVAGLAFMPTAVLRCYFVPIRPLSGDLCRISA